MSKGKKSFDAVDMMRKIRNRLPEPYDRKPEERLKRLQAIREKYGIKEPSETV